jgi:hypothetical protein
MTPPKQDGTWAYPYYEGACIDMLRPNITTVVWLVRGTSLHYWEYQYMQDVLTGNMFQVCLIRWKEYVRRREGIFGFLRKELTTHESEHLGQILHQAKYYNNKVALILSTNEVKLRDLVDCLSRDNVHYLPALLIHLSDEDLAQDPRFYSNLVDPDGLVLRQYHIANEKLPKSPQVRTMPLGYAEEFPVNTDSCAAITINAQSNATRFLAWTFVGTVYDHRKEMINTLSATYALRSFVKSASADAHGMFHLYKDTMFVPIGRGHVNLDCFRIYEAVISGAIPVIVGPPEEISQTFADHQDPPFVFAESWSAAARQMALLRHDFLKWRAHADRLAPWWCNWLRSLRLQVSNVLKH